MVTLTFGDIRNYQFTSALKKLATHEGLPVKVASNLGEILKSVRNFELKCLKLHNELAQKYAEKDDLGKFKAPEGSPEGSFQVPEKNAEKFKAEMEELRNVTAKLPVSPIRLDQLEPVGLSPDQLLAVSCLVTPITAVQ